MASTSVRSTKNRPKPIRVASLKKRPPFTLAI
ncbi:UNVERIFIED_CONTAM: hypothetical protein GTU68_012354 [Idotea baltica]|nr:hypothetical protein [Idotea baltica]